MTQTDVKDLHNTIKLMLTSGTNHPIILYDNEFTIELILSEKRQRKNNNDSFGKNYYPYYNIVRSFENAVWVI